MRIGSVVRSNKKLRVGINGFGRIGRLAFRICHARSEEFEVVLVNDLTSDATLEYLLKYDSVHGRFDAKIDPAGAGEFLVDGRRVIVTADRDPAAIKWGEHGVDIVIESTGIFRSREKAAKHLTGGAKKVVISAPAKGEVDATVVMGVNHQQLEARHKVVSNASCTTNALAPVVKVLQERFGIARGLMSTVHAYTNDQRLLDLPHDDFRRARAAGQNIVPSTTGAAEAVGIVLPAVAGKMRGIALRVPVPDGSIVDLVVDLEKDTSTEELNGALREASEKDLQGVMAYTEDEIVSSDIVGQPESSIVDGASTDVLQKRMAKVLAWYDNEWAYSCRVVDLMAHMGNVGF